jgi:hypothetical protein
MTQQFIHIYTGACTCICSECHFPTVVVQFGPKKLQWLFMLAASFLEMFFSFISCSEFVVLTYNIQGKIISGKSVAKVT